jgi:hypothetical protein
VLLGNVVNQFLYEDGLAHAGAAEQSDFAAFQEGLNEIDDLHAGFKHFGGGGLVLKQRRGAMYRHGLGVLDRTQLVHGLTDHVHDPT